MTDPGSVVRLRCLVILGLARAVPLLLASSCAVADGVVEVIDVGPATLGTYAGRRALSEVSAELFRFVEQSVGHDGLLADYVQSRIAFAAATIAGEIEDVPMTAGRLFDELAEAWANCDALVHTAAAWRDPPFSSLKTTLLGVEYRWRDNDELAMASSSDPLATYRRRMAAVDDSGRRERRQAVVVKVVELAGWRQ